MCAFFSVNGVSINGSDIFYEGEDINVYTTEESYENVTLACINQLDANILVRDPEDDDNPDAEYNIISLDDITHIESCECPCGYEDEEDD